MPTYLSIIQYRPWLAWAGFFSMAFFRLPLFFNRDIHFYKLMGCGKNGTFDIHPDLKQWAIFSVHSNESKHEWSIHVLYGPLIHWWIKLLATEILIIKLDPVSGHGSWDGKKMTIGSSGPIDANEPIATLTRATIRINKLKQFWKNVAPVAQAMTTAPGYRFSVGIGEIPWIKQATFSIWDTEIDMKNFAYKMNPHNEVIKKTRKEQWYSEDMFVRFRIKGIKGDMAKFTPVRIKH